LLPALPVQGQWLLIALSAVGFDLGLQSSLVAHQNLVYSLEPQARGRLNALLFTMVFIGMALGSVLGSQVYALANWEGVVTLATFSSAIALVIRLTGNPSLSKRRLPKKCPLRGVKGAGRQTYPVSRYVQKGLLPIKLEQRHSLHIVNAL
jgi:hypothetical protein